MRSTHVLGSHPTCSDTPTGGGTCCGDGNCEPPHEDSNICPIDCQPAVCGDGGCDPGEDQCSCAIDCGTPPSTEAGLCDDGVDNDCGGGADCADSDCSSDPACTCGNNRAPCTTDADCCSNNCGKRGMCNGNG